MNGPHKVIGMFSGGLDSLLCARIMALEGFDVTAVHFYTGFTDTHVREIERGPHGPWQPSPAVVESARSIGVRLLPIDVSGEEFAALVANPPNGYGSAANPCIDCKAWLLGKAREIMEAEGAILVFTGEVVGQRPMSQHKPALARIMKQSGLEGRLLRPLSAKLLEPTIPEREGIVNREHLYDFHGRSRNPQQALALELGIENYPSSGGGCLLTDPSFGKKFKDLVAGLGDRAPLLHDLYTLKTGRHLRFAGGCKAVVGRTEKENEWLEALFGGEAWAFSTRDHPGATVFVPGEPDEADALLLARIAARYGKGRHLDEVPVTARRGEDVREYHVHPAAQEEIEGLLIC